MIFPKTYRRWLHAVNNPQRNCSATDCQKDNSLSPALNGRKVSSFSGATGNKAGYAALGELSPRGSHDLKNGAVIHSGRR